MGFPMSVNVNHKTDACTTCMRADAVHPRRVPFGCIETAILLMAAPREWSRRVLSARLNNSVSVQTTAPSSRKLQCGTPESQRHAYNTLLETRQDLLVCSLRVWFSDVVEYEQLVTTKHVSWTSSRTYSMRLISMKFITSRTNQNACQMLWHDYLAKRVQLTLKRNPIWTYNSWSRSI